MPPRKESLLREQEARKYLAMGVPQATIAEWLHVDPRTVRNYARRLRREMEAMGLAAS